MKKVFVAVLMVILAGLFALPGVASAQVDDPTVEGRGWLYAKGTGSVDIDMGGRIRMRLDGDVIITDHAGDLRVELHGGAEQRQAEAESGTDIILNDFTGALRVRGSNFTVHADGDVMLNAHGRGSAWLEGDGVYKTRRGDRMVWDGMVAIGGTEVQPA